MRLRSNELSTHVGEQVTVAGWVQSIRRLAKVAKLAGAPAAPAAGATVHARLGDRVAAGQPLYTLHAETPGELDYALEFAASHAPVFTVEPE